MSVGKKWMLDGLVFSCQKIGLRLQTARYGHSCGILQWYNPLSELLEDIVVVTGRFNGFNMRTSVTSSPSISQH